MKIKQNDDKEEGVSDNDNDNEDERGDERRLKC